MKSWLNFFCPLQSFRGFTFFALARSCYSDIPLWQSNAFAVIMPRPSKRAKLLSDAESEGEEEAPQQNGFQVNEEYANRFEHNKKREERQQLEEKFKKTGQANGLKRGAPEDEDESEDSEDDESEDDDADLATKDLDDEIFATLNAIKSKDPRVYDKDVRFYKEFDTEGGAENGEAKKEKPMYLQDYHRQNLLAGHAGGEGDDDAPQKTYQQEQDAMREKLVGSMHAHGTQGDSEASEDDEDDFLVTKSKQKHDDMPATKTRQITDNDIAAADKDPETYLSNFMAARAWLPSEGSRWQALESDDSGDDERADAFEEAYNMRFEDPKNANEKLQSFSRDVGKYGVRREEKGGRKRAREREREQKEQAKREREEERARLRKLKIEEAEDKVKRIKDAAGMRGQEIDLEQWRDIIEGDFDDDKWETEMKRRFGEDYYAAEEEQEDFGEEEEADGSKKHRLKKPKWDDDLDIKDLVPDFDAEEKPTATLSDDEDEGGVALPADDEEASDDEEPAKKKKKPKKDRATEKAAAKRTARLERRAIEDMVDKSIPDLPSQPQQIGFRYRETSPTSFGLSAKDILFADDAQLNQFAGLKKMAAFRDEEKKRRDRKKFSKKGRLRQWRKETFGDAEGPKDPVRGSGANADAVGGAKEKGVGSESAGNVREGERGKKRKRSKKGKEMKA